MNSQCSGHQALGREIGLLASIGCVRVRFSGPFRVIRAHRDDLVVECQVAIQNPISKVLAT